jgi:hypothetical protein
LVLDNLKEKIRIRINASAYKERKQCNNNKKKKERKK